MNVLWDLGPATVRDVHSRLAATSPTQYTTTLKLMQIMVGKGLLTRDESSRAHTYVPSFRQEQMQADVAGDLLDRVFAGSAAALMQRAIGKRKLTPADIAELRMLIDEYEGEMK